MNLQKYTFDSLSWTIDHSSNLPNYFFWLVLNRFNSDQLWTFSKCWHDAIESLHFQFYFVASCFTFMYFFWSVTQLRRTKNFHFILSFSLIQKFVFPNLFFFLLFNILQDQVKTSRHPCLKPSTWNPCFLTKKRNL